MKTNTFSPKPFGDIEIELLGKSDHDALKKHLTDCGYDIDPWELSKEESERKMIEALVEFARQAGNK